MDAEDLAVDLESDSLHALWRLRSPARRSKPDHKAEGVDPPKPEPAPIMSSNRTPSRPPPPAPGGGTSARSVQSAILVAASGNDSASSQTTTASSMGLVTTVTPSRAGSTATAAAVAAVSPSATSALASQLDLALGPRPLVLLLDAEDATVEAKVLGKLVPGGCDVRAIGLRSGAEAVTHALLPLADAVLVWHTLHIDSNIIARLSRARALVRVGVGYDNVDLACAGRAGLPVVNVPNYGTEEVADHAMSLLLDLFRRTSSAAASIRAGRAAQGASGCAAAAAGARRLRGCVLGLVGCGLIGSAVSQRAKAFGLDVVFYDPYAVAGLDKALGVRRVDSALALARQSDAISCHCDLNATSRHIVDAAFLRAMPRGGYIVNTARGGVVDEAALATALLDGHIAGAGIDVHETEPFTEDPEKQPLAGVPNCICTPHTAFFSEESYVELRTLAATAAAHALASVPLANVVNAKFLPRSRDAGLRADLAPTRA